MATRDPHTGRRGPLSASGPLAGATIGADSIDRRPVVAVGLTLLMVLSVLAVPAAGAALGGATESVGPSADLAGSSGPAGPAPSAKGGPPDSAGKSEDAGKPDDAGRPDHAGNDDDDDDDDDRHGPPTTEGEAGDRSTARPDHAGTPGPAEHADDGQSDRPTDRPSGEQRGPPEHASDGGPTVSVSRGNADPPGPAGDGPPDRTDGVPAASVVEVDVQNARAGDDLSVDVSPGPDEPAPIAFERVSLTVRRGGDFSLQVLNSRDPLPGSPAFETDDDVAALGRIRLVHTISNEDVESVSFVVRVEKEQLREAGSRPQDVSLYRYSDGEWTPLPTDIVAETETAYVLAVESPGMSEFAVGAKRPTFDTYWARAGASTVDPGEAVRIVGRVMNTGGADGVHRAELRVDGEVVEVRRVTVAAGGTRQVNFRLTLDRPGSHTVTVGDVPAGTVEVRGADPSEETGSVGRAFSFALNRVLDVGRLLLAG